MKFFSVILLMIPFCLKTYGQMDDKFYFPSKKWNKIDSVKHTEQTFFIEKDTLHGVWLYPNIKKPKATILYFHGSGGNVSRYIKYVKPLVQDGFQVFMIDFRGYGKSSGKPTHKNIATDAQIVLDAILKDNKLKQQKLIVYGASMGSQVACNLTKNNEDKISAIVLDGCIASFTDIALASMPVEQHEMARPFLVFPYGAKEDIKTITKSKILLIHSKEDKEVPYSHYEMVLANAKKDALSWIYTGGHLEAPLLHPKEFINQINILIK
ncbi:alpha/beta hydrolase [bacterium 336/3]|nr:alpha/beta hydrolase [bacterium 336/3]